MSSLDLHSNKTVIVLDRGSAQCLKPCLQPLELDTASKSRGLNVIPLAPISKTVWTCNIEAVLEFCRVVYDLFSEDKQVRVIIGDENIYHLNNWETAEQSLPHLMNRLGEIPKATSGSESLGGTISGLSKAVQALTQPTPVQLNAWSEGEEEVSNRGRIICLTHLKNDAQVQNIESCVQEALVQYNATAQDSDSLLQIEHLELVLLQVIPVTKVSPVGHRTPHEVSPQFRSEVQITQSGNYVAQKLIEFAMNFYSLAVTTVTGIPMKEEQNASSSANYDVELLHTKTAHDEIFNAGCSEGVIMPSKEGLYTKTICLRWCTPKIGAPDIQQCTSAYRFTPVDVASRPSSCLTNFLLSGRSVMLEQPRKGGNKVLSHMLTCHGGELYIHTLATGRSPLEDPPAITEGPGGRLTDYRITDFQQLMEATALAPLPDKKDKLPIAKAKHKLERLTRMWPLTLNESILFNTHSNMEALISRITKDSLTTSDVVESKNVIFSVLRMETNGDPLPTPTSFNTTKSKGPKKEELYRHLWSELERLTQAYSGTSPEHAEVLQCVLDCRSGGSKRTKNQTEEPQDLVKTAWQEYERYNTMTEREKQDLNHPVSKRSSDSSPPAKQAKVESIFSKSNGPTNVLMLWTSNMKASIKPKQREFSGRLQYGNKAELYKNLRENKTQLLNKKESNDANGLAAIKKIPLPS